MVCIYILYINQPMEEKKNKVRIKKKKKQRTSEHGVLRLHGNRFLVSVRTLSQT